MVKQLIIDGKISFLRQIKTFLWWLAIITPWSILFIPQEFEEFGEIGWNVLIAVMLIRPLADFLPEFKIFRSLVILRREGGIFSGLMIIAHFIGYSMTHGGIWATLFTAENWSINNYLMWGIVGMLASLPPLITSNKFSMRLLKKNWKSVQKFAYLFFIFGGIHVAMIDNISAAIWVGIFIFLIMASQAKFSLKLFRP